MDYDETHLMDELEEGPFTFVGEVLALDLVNTLVVVRGKQRDLLQTPADVAAWWDAARRHHPNMDNASGSPVVYDAKLVERVKWLRDGLRQICTVIIGGQPPKQDDSDILNQVLSAGYPALAWANPAPQRIYRYEANPQAEILLPVALSALRLLTETDLSRLHKCHNQRCILLFYDHTRSATRQWCSKACFERERSALRYEQSKRQAGK